MSICRSLDLFLGVKMSFKVVSVVITVFRNWGWDTHGEARGAEMITFIIIHLYLYLFVIQFIFWAVKGKVQLRHFVCLTILFYNKSNS